MPVFWVALALGILVPCACFLALAVSPRLFGQGSQWFTLEYLRSVITGYNATALFNSVWVSAVACIFGAAVGGAIAWAVLRTNMPGRRLVPIGMWLVLLLPSWLPSLGWLILVRNGGVLQRAGIHAPWLTNAILGWFGVVLLLGIRCVPFAFLAISVALRGLGREFDDAARVHGAGRWQSLRVVAPIIAPAIWSALAIGFAESISDFGVAATLGATANFPLATYSLYNEINSFPPSFPTAAAIGWLLVAAVALPLAFQARALRGKSYTVLSGRMRPATRHRLRWFTAVGAATAVAVFFVAALAVPAIGAVVGSMLTDRGSSISVTWVNYRAVFQTAEFLQPLELSVKYGVIAASLTAVVGFVVARLLTGARTVAVRALDFLLLAAVAIPSVLFAAGYIFAYNLPIMAQLGIDLYQTQTLLVIAYSAASLPFAARLLVGPVSQLQKSLSDAGRTHGSGPVRAWWRGVFPVVSRPLLVAWLLTFTGVFLELPITSLLYAPSYPPLAIGIQDNLGNYHFGLGMAQAVIAVAFALLVVGGALGLYALLAPRGWRRLGEASNG
jgi:iron(III) transport system permease protein